MMSQPRISEREYFHRFRWWLRREYQHYLQQEAIRQRRQNMEPKSKPNSGA